ncbi:MAG: AsmA-like C-terminal region-containing protein [Planctomycetaceae bacterium]|nr:AsmA-like C-terminal region-containing protein [Planctomycetaceae bacterium]
MAQQARNTQADAAESAAPRRRRWPWIVAIVVVVLAALVFAAPYVASTTWGKDAIVSSINKRIDQTVTVGTLSLTWMGPCEIKDVRVLDSRDRQIALIRSVNLQRGVLGLALSPYHFDKVTLTDPRVTIFVGEPSEETGPSSAQLPEPVGQVVVVDAQVLLQRPDGRSIDVRQLNADLTLDTLDRVKGQFHGALASGGDVSGTVNLDNIQEGFSQGIDRLSGTFAVASDRPVNLGPLVHFADASLPFQGTANLRTSGAVAQRKLDATIVADAKGLTSARPQHGQTQAMDVRIETRVSGDNGIAHGTTIINSSAGRLDAQWAYPLGAPLPQLGGGDILEAIWGGRDLNLPDLTLKGSGKFDMPALARSVPALLNVQGGVQITGGTLALDDLSLTGGPKAAVAMHAALNDFTAQKSGKTISLQPVTLNLDAAMDGEKGLQIRQGKLDSDFLKAAASGAATDMNLTYRVDVGELRSQLGEVFDLHALPEKGLAEGTATMSKAAEDRVALEVKLSARDFHQRVGGRSVAIEQATLVQTGHILIERRRPVQLVVERGQAVVGQDLTASDNGRYDFRTGAMSLDVNVTQSRLEGLAALVRSAAAPDLPEMRGGLTAKARMTRSAQGVFDLILGDARVQGLQALSSGRPAPTAAIDAAFSGEMKIASDRTTATIKTTGKAAAIEASLAYSTGATWPASARDLLAAATEGKPLNMPPLTVALTGRIDATELSKAVPALVAMGGDTVLHGGTMDIREASLRGGPQPSFNAQAEIASLNLTRGGRPIAIAKGTLDVAMSIQQDTLISRGKLTVTELSLDNRPVGKGPIALDWSGLEYAAATQRLAVASASLVSSFANAAAGNLNASLGQDFRLEGTAEASADLAPVMDVVRPLAASAQAGRPAPPLQLAGHANWKGAFQTVGKTVSIEGRGGVSNFVAGNKTQPVNLNFEQIIAIDRRSDSMDVRALKVNSQPNIFTMTASGTLDRFKKDMNADITGQYTGSWPYIMELLNQFAPAVERELVVTGQTRGDFFIRGPINKPGVQPGWRDLTAQTTVSWQTIKVRNFGISMEGARMTPSLSGGRIGIPITPVSAMDGQVVLAGTVVATGPANNFDLQGQHQVLKSLKISAELGKNLLSRFNPIFADAVGIEGRVSMTLDDFYWPLDQAQIRQARGKGVLNLGDLKLRVGGPLGKLLGPINNALMPALTDSMNFEIRDGRVYYDNFKFVYAGTYDIRFRGSVAFVDDERLDLVMSLPITPDVLQQFKVAGPVNEISRVLGDQRIDIPLSGTRFNPIPHPEKVNLQPMVAKAMEQLLKEGILKGGLIPRPPGDATPREPGSLLPLPGLPIPGLDKNKKK